MTEVTQEVHSQELLLPALLLACYRYIKRSMRMALHAVMEFRLGGRAHAAGQDHVQARLCAESATSQFVVTCRQRAGT